LIATQRHLFSHRKCTLLLLISVFSFPHHSLCLCRRPLPFRYNTRSLLKRSLARSVCSDVPAGLSSSLLPAARARRIALNFFPQKAGAAAGRPAACATAKGASRRRPRRHPKKTPPCPLPLGLDTILRAVTTTATPPQILLLGCSRLVLRKTSSR
jgi:hypothetical protein